jgi:hypothetical protein
VIITAVLAVLGAGCTNATTSSTNTAKRVPQPAGRNPSPIATMVCASEARKIIASGLGVTATVSTPTWADHVYSCDYAYPTGSMTLSVKELSSYPETKAYFQTLQNAMGKTRDLPGLGQGAFQTTDGSVVVRKDYKVLLVDSSKLPAQFGIPPTSSGAVAVTVADLILGCWAGD